MIFENFIIYDDSTGKQRKVLNDINERIAEKLEEIEINDIDVSQRLQKELKRDYHIITAEKRPQEIQKIKKVAKELLETLKEKLKNLYKWQDREPTRDEVKVLIRNFLWDDATGLPTEYYTQNDVNRKTEAVFYHVYRAYPTVPSPYYASVGN